MIFLPRGWIHQGFTSETTSHHITVSANQSNTWADFFTKFFNEVVKKVSRDDVEFRKTLPLTM